MLATTSGRTLSRALFPQQTLIRHAILVVAGSALIALSAQVSLHIPIGPVPITGQTFAVLLVGAVLGPRLGALAAALYIGEGIAHLPVYAGGASGWGVITGSSGGYLLSYPPAAFAVGWLARAGWDRRPITLAAAMLVGNAIIYVFGLPWLANWMAAHETDPGLVLQWGLIPFIPGDLAKLLLAASLVPAGWLALRAIPFGPEHVQRRERAPSALELGPVAIAAGAVLALSAFLPWRPGELGIEAGAGWAVLGAGVAATAGVLLRRRGALGAELAQLWIFAAAALGGLVAFVNLVDFTADGRMELADIRFGLPVAVVAALVLLAFLASEASAGLVAAEDDGERKDGAGY